MQTRLNPYLGFKDNAHEAMDFYKSVFGGVLTISTFGDAHTGDPTETEKVMHAMLETEGGLVLMASDTPNEIEYKKGNGSFSISLSGDNEIELRKYWDKLSEGATVVLPLEQAPWGDHFGMLTDKYGTSWMVNITATKE
jgi:PhnB protein